MESLLRIWDLILSEPSTTRTETPKVDLLLDVCTAMLLLARKPLLQAGKRRSGQVGLWGDTDEVAGDFGEVCSGFHPCFLALNSFDSNVTPMSNDLRASSKEWRIFNGIPYTELGWTTSSNWLKNPGSDEFWPISTAMDRKTKRSVRWSPRQPHLLLRSLLGCSELPTDLPPRYPPCLKKDPRLISQTIAPTTLPLRNLLGTA